MASLLYDDGRIGIASGILTAGCDALATVLAGILPDDPDAASEAEARIARIRVDSSAATSIANVADALSSAIVASRDVARLAGNAESAAAVWLAAAGVAAVLQASSSASPATLIASRLANAVAGCFEAAFVGEYAIALSQSSFADRQSALAAKARIASVAEPALERVATACGREVWQAVSAATQHATDYLAARALDLRPVVMVSTPNPAPATALAWALYGDTQRADELVDRNRVGTPAFMPTRFEALAP